jgi:hypothetical protein
MELLHAHILSKDPTAIVEVIKGWPVETGIEIEDRMIRRIKTFPFDDPCNHYLLFDNAHDTYWDGLLWETLFKDNVQRHRSGPFAILFCSYGSPTTQPVDHETGTPLCLPCDARVSLTPSNTTTLAFSPIGLLFSREEFNEAIERHKDADRTIIRLDQALQDMLFEWTMGHAGAVGDLLFKLTHLVSYIHIVIYRFQTHAGTPKTTRRWNAHH